MKWTKYGYDHWVREDGLTCGIYNDGMKGKYFCYQSRLKTHDAKILKYGTRTQCSTYLKKWRQENESN